MNKDNTSGRKNENLHALYSILDYCEEPFVCRRKLQLNFLGEEFDQNNCGNMCDNCRKGLQVTNRDCTSEALKIIDIVTECEKLRCNVSVKQMIDIVRGLSVKA